MTALREEQKHLQEQVQYAIGQMEAAKKAASDREEMNRILQLQNQELQQKLVRYDALKESEEQAQKEAAALQLKIRELQQTLEHETGQKKNLEQIATQAQQQVREMENQKLEDRMLLADLKRQLSDKDSDTQAMLKQVRMQAELEQERAVIAKEREMQEELRKADRETRAASGRAGAATAAADPGKHPGTACKANSGNARHKYHSRCCCQKYRKGVMRHDRIAVP